MYGFRRNEPYPHNNRLFIHDNVTSTICKFIVRDDYIITGHRYLAIGFVLIKIIAKLTSYEILFHIRAIFYRDGSMRFWTRPQISRNIDFYFSIEHAHSRSLNALDETFSAIISGAGDGTVKV